MREFGQPIHIELCQLSCQNILHPFSYFKVVSEHRILLAPLFWNMGFTHGIYHNLSYNVFGDLGYQMALKKNHRPHVHHRQNGCVYYNNDTSAINKKSYYNCIVCAKTTHQRPYMMIQSLRRSHPSPILAKFNAFGKCQG